MALYSLILFRNGEPTGKNIALDFADDLDALDAAYAVCADQEVEIRNGERLVARVKQGNQSWNAADPQSG